MTTLGTVPNVVAFGEVTGTATLGFVNERYDSFSRSQWALLREATPLELTEGDLAELRGINERLDLEEVANIYLPLSRLLNLHITATQRLSTVTDLFLSTDPSPVPYVIGLGGSVAVGKSTTARVLQALLSSWPQHQRVDLVTTDGFLYPNTTLADRDLMDRKGFPESYDTAGLIDFLRSVKSGNDHAEAPVYSHLVYDVVDGESVLVQQPDVLIVEGLNVLQSHHGSGEVVVSDFFDFTIYVDADEALIERWYVERFLAFRESVFQDPASYFRNYARLTDEEAEQTARHIWATINAPNLRDNIAPTRDRAQLILTKGIDHRIEQVQLRKS